MKQQQHEVTTSILVIKIDVCWNGKKVELSNEQYKIVLDALRPTLESK
jgi:hypothetical protein